MFLIFFLFYIYFIILLFDTPKHSLNIIRIKTQKLCFFSFLFVKLFCRNLYFCFSSLLYNANHQAKPCSPR